MFILEHGPDNYSEGIDLHQLAFYRASWEHLAADTCGVMIVKIVMHSGFQDSLRFTIKDYERFQKEIKRLNIRVVQAGEQD
jgi:hypothetical protein